MAAAAVVQHYEQYTATDIEQNAVRLLTAAGVDPDHPAAADMYSFDQMHGLFSATHGATAIPIAA